MAKNQTRKNHALRPTLLAILLGLGLGGVALWLLVRPAAQPTRLSPAATQRGANQLNQPAASLTTPEVTPAGSTSPSASASPGPTMPGGDTAGAASWLQQGNVYREAGETAAALVAYQQARSLDPQLGDAYLNAAAVLWQQGDQSAALNLLRTGLAAQATRASDLQETLSVYEALQR